MTYDRIFAGTSPLDVAITTRQVAETVDLPLTPSQRTALLVAAKAVELHYPIFANQLAQASLSDERLRALAKRIGLDNPSRSALVRMRDLLVAAATEELERRGRAG